MEENNIIKKEHSGMIFLCDKSYTFFIEDTGFYRKNFKMNRIRTVEFIRFRNNEIQFIEAKSKINHYVEFESNIKEISEKFIHSLNMLAAIFMKTVLLNGKGNDCLPKKINSLKTPFNITFIVIDRTEDDLEQLSQIQETITEQIPTFIKTIWKPTILVLNAELALEEKIICKIKKTKKDL
jgi:hypothetical protein